LGGAAQLVEQRPLKPSTAGVSLQQVSACAVHVTHLPVIPFKPAVFPLELAFHQCSLKEPTAAAMVDLTQRQ